MEFVVELTAGIDLPSRAAYVEGPTSPSAWMPCVIWKLLTASTVAGP